MRRLDQLAVQAKNYKRFIVSVEGFTDNIGTRQYNEALSQQRAQSVVHYLVTRYDIPVYRIHMVGLGADKPVALSRTANARSQNRRVEVKVLSADGVAASLNGRGVNQASR